MFKPVFGLCRMCKKNKLLVVKKLLCLFCNHRIKKENKKNYTKINKSIKPIKRTPLKRKPIKKKFRKKTGEKELFLQIWESRDHYCANKNCKIYLGEEPLVHYFAHIKSK